MFIGRSTIILVEEILVEEKSQREKEMNLQQALTLLLSLRVLKHKPTSNFQANDTDSGLDLLQVSLSLSYRSTIVYIT
jgi:hypothetical protein